MPRFPGAFLWRRTMNKEDNHVEDGSYEECEGDDVASDMIRCNMCLRKDDALYLKQHWFMGTSSDGVKYSVSQLVGGSGICIQVEGHSNPKMNGNWVTNLNSIVEKIHEQGFEFIQGNKET